MKVPAIVYEAFRNDGSKDNEILLRESEGKVDRYILECLEELINEGYEGLEEAHDLMFDYLEMDGETHADESEDECAYEDDTPESWAHVPRGFETWDGRSRCPVCEGSGCVRN